MRLTLTILFLLINVSAWAGTPIPYVTNNHFNSYSAARAAEVKDKTAQTGVLYGNGSAISAATSAQIQSAIGGGVYDAYGAAASKADLTAQTWSPTFTGLSIAGTATITGNYVKSYTSSGAQCCWWVQVVPNGASTTESTMSSTTFTVPLALSGIPAPFATSSNYFETFPNGIVYTGTTAYAPTWAATNHAVYMNGCYQTSP